MDILSVAQMRAIERIADARGLSYAQMMQNAGRAAADVILRRLRDLGLHERPRVLVLVGPGNNGGDGLVCAAALAGAGVTVQCYLLKPRSEDDPVFVAARDRGIFIADAANDMRFRVLHQMVTHADMIVDALLGTGTSRPVEGELRDILREVALRRQGSRATGRREDLPTAPCYLIALDGVTGMNYDTGALDPAAVPADLTITFHAPKRGHFCFPAAGACGELVVVPIGIAEVLPAAAFDRRSALENLPDHRFADLDEATRRELSVGVELADDARVRALLPARRPDGNKGTFGRVLIVGGCNDYIGAPGLAARAAYRVGAGLVTLVVPQAITLAVAAACSEATFVASPESSERHTPASLRHVVNWYATVKGGVTMALGPGMGQARDTAEFLSALLESITQGRIEINGWVCDADALNLLAQMPQWHARLPGHTVLTPHPGEMARLTGLSVTEVQADRIGLALRYARAWGHIVLLKGAHTIIAAPDDRAVVVPFANPAMATAGTGDVLAGCIAGLMAQGLSPFDAAVCGAYLHGAAGERWRKLHGDAGMLASDLLPLLPDVMRDLRTES